ncbi:MAG: hypothetical protein K2P78_15215 [Gemmataceae bacterium]|nr:hypothetical protein [Gemmataceae bacterium]
MVESMLLIAALVSVPDRAGAPVTVSLKCDVEGGRPNDHVLVKVRLVNRSEAAVPFAPPLGQAQGNLEYQLLAPDAAQYLPLRKWTEVNIPQSPGGLQSGAVVVSYDYLSFMYLQDKPDGRNPTHRPPRVFSIEGLWRVRAAVRVGNRTYYSPAALFEVKGRHAESTADALSACSERLSRWEAVPYVFPNDKDVLLFQKHQQSLSETQAGVSVRRALLLDKVIHADNPELRKQSINRVMQFRETCSSLQQEYTDLLLAVALVKCGEGKTARELLRTINESSALRDYVARESRIKD